MKKTFIAENMKLLRKSGNITQEGLGNIIGIKRSLVAAYEEGRAEPSIYTVWKICKHFNITIEDFISPGQLKLNKVENEDKEFTVVKKLDMVRQLLKDIEAETKFKVYMELQ